MKKSELFTKIELGIICALALVAVILQIINERTTPLETTYEIITFSVALVAVILAVIQGMENARMTRELRKITREIKENLDEIETLSRAGKKLTQQIREIDRDNEQLEQTLRDDMKLDEKMLKKLNQK